MTSLKKLAPPPYVTLQPAKYTPGDYGKPGTWTNTHPAFTAKERRLTGTEKVVAGVDTAVKLYRYWTDAPVPFSEAQSLRHPTQGELNVTAITPYPERGITIIEAKKVGS